MGRMSTDKKIEELVRVVRELVSAHEDSIELLEKLRSGPPAHGYEDMIRDARSRVQALASMRDDLASMRDGL